MEDKKEELKKGIKLILFAAIAYFIVQNISIVGNIYSKIIKIIFPFILGGCLAFIINIPMNFFEKKLKKMKNKKGKQILNNKKIVRGISLILSIFVIIFIFLLIINLIVPELINIVKMLINNVPYYVEEINKILAEHTESMELISNIKVNTESIKEEIIQIIPNVLTSSISIIGSIVGTISDVVIAIIFAMYLLIGKEKLQNQIRRILYAYIRKEKVDKIIEIATISRNTFANFFTVQCFEATILGSLCVIGMLILRIPYALPIGILIGVTALIPVVGAFIGIIVGAILIVSVNPIKVITFVVFVLILQQIEGNVIYPRVVGNSVGLPGMWVLVAVTIGGSLGGIIGMLVGVPIASVIYTIIKNDVSKKLSVTIHSLK